MPTAPKRFRPQPARRPLDRRPNASQRGYDARWQKVSKRRLANEPFCRMCTANGVLGIAAKVADHIIPVDVRPDLRLHYDNTQALCVACNAKKAVLDAKRYPAARRQGGGGEILPAG